MPDEPELGQDLASWDAPIGSAGSFRVIRFPRIEAPLHQRRRWVFPPPEQRNRRHRSLGQAASGPPSTTSWAVPRSRVGAPRISFGVMVPAEASGGRSETGIPWS